MTGYTKVFGSMLDSSVWQLSKEARLLWVTMLLKKDRNQLVKAAVPGLAHAARLTIPEVESAIEELCSPDPYSQSKEQNGARIVKTDFGWLIVNGEKYRDMMSADDRRVYKAAWQREYRKRKKVTATDGAKGGARQAINEGLAESNGHSKELSATEKADLEYRKSIGLA